VFVQRVGSKGAFTAIDLAMRIGPLKAEDAAKEGREWTILVQLDVCYGVFGLRRSSAAA
jgi:hypothetical protein